MRRISIDQFGPITHFEADLDAQVTILIGEQATGKSTILKLIYVCKKFLYDYYLHFKHPPDSAPDLLEKDHTSLFLKIFHDMARSDTYRIEYAYYGLTLTITSQGGYPSFRFGGDESSEIIASHDNSTIYIPSGRSLFPLVASSFGASRLSFDEITERFFLYLSTNRKRYTQDLSRVLEDAIRTQPFPIDRDSAQAAMRFIDLILKGSYAYKNDVEQLQLKDGTSIPLALASSGQQEIVYILLTLYSCILDRLAGTIMIEEPEAHIYPSAQLLLMKLIATAINAYGGLDVVLTTHSPYILTSTNLLLESGRVETGPTAKGSIVEPSARLKRVKAFLLMRNGAFAYRDIMDGDTGLIDAGVIDAVSESINTDMERLLDLEVQYGL